MRHVGFIPRVAHPPSQRGSSVVGTHKPSVQSGRGSGPQELEIVTTDQSLEREVMTPVNSKAKAKVSAH